MEVTKLNPDFFDVVNNIESKLQQIENKNISLADDIAKFRYNCKCIEDIMEYLEKSFNHKLKTLESKCDKLIDIHNKKIIIKTNEINETIVKNKLELIIFKNDLNSEIKMCHYTLIIVSIAYLFNLFLPYLT